MPLLGKCKSLKEFRDALAKQGIKTTKVTILLYAHYGKDLIRNLLQAILL